MLRELDRQSGRRSFSRSLPLWRVSVFPHSVLSYSKSSSVFPGEPLHGFRVCIQAVLQDKPRIATQNLPEVRIGLADVFAAGRPALTPPCASSAVSGAAAERPQPARQVLDHHVGPGSSRLLRPQPGSPG